MCVHEKWVVCSERVDKLAIYIYIYGYECATVKTHTHTLIQADKYFLGLNMLTASRTNKNICFIERINKYIFMSMNSQILRVLFQTKYLFFGEF